MIGLKYENVNWTEVLKCSVQLWNFEKTVQL